MEFGVNEILLLVSGLALFLLGMNSMGDGLEKACGNKMKMILEKLTKNRFIGVLVDFERIGDHLLNITENMINIG